MVFLELRSPELDTVLCGCGLMRADWKGSNVSLKHAGYNIFNAPRMPLAVALFLKISHSLGISGLPP